GSLLTTTTSASSSEVPVAKKKPKKKAKPNPVKVDPTRTLTMRRKLLQTISARLNAVAAAARAVVLGKGPTGRWEFATDEEKVNEFKAYIRRQVQAGLIDLPDAATVPRGVDPYWAAYIRAGYAKGAGRAYTDARKLPSKAAAGPVPVLRAKGQA